MPLSFAHTIMSRKSPTLAIRESQLVYNRLAVDGGRPYVNARLWRAPNESDLSWVGKRAVGNEAVSFGMVGRKDRTTLVNDAGRIASKIEQYIFKQPVARDGASAEFLANMGGMGVDALDFWMSVNNAFTWGQWCWVGASRDRVAATMRDRSSENAVKWQLYPSLAVQDWSLDENGRINWLITETKRTEDSDPFLERKDVTIRTLWRKTDGGVSVISFSNAEDGVAQAVSDEEILPLDEVPFVLIGKPNDSPWWFDDVEAIACQLLNLDSIHIDNLVRCVFPQLVISEGTFDQLQSKLYQSVGAENGNRVLQVVKEVVRGADMPIVESAQESGITRFICPSAQDLKALPDEIERKRKLLFDITGLSLFNKETRQTQTAESKQFDMLDTESTLKNRALIMQAAEEHLIAISKTLDPAFAEYVPVWPQSFDVVDTAADMQVVTMVGNLPDTTPAMRKMAMRSAVRILQEVSGYDSGLADEAYEEIKAQDFAQSDVPLSELVPDADGNGTPPAQVGEGEIAEVSMNGAQVQSIVAIVKEVAAGALPLESARALIKAAFPAVDDAIVSALIEPLRSFKPKTSAALPSSEPMA